MAQVWGLAQERPATRAEADRQERARVARERRRLSPEAVRSGHKGIFWLHFSAILVWLLVAGVFGVLIAAGKNVPPAVVLASIAAMAGHGLFLATHLFLASLARRRAAAASASKA